MQRLCHVVLSRGIDRELSSPFSTLEPDHGGPQSVHDDQKQDGQDEDNDHKDGADGGPDDKRLNQETGRGSHHAADEEHEHQRAEAEAGLPSRWRGSVAQGKYNLHKIGRIGGRRSESSPAAVVGNLSIIPIIRPMERLAIVGR
jgi:hypothetical protein